MVFQEGLEDELFSLVLNEESMFAGDYLNNNAIRKKFKQQKVNWKGKSYF